MALNTQQIANLNALNQKIAGGYKPTATDTANLDYAKKQGYVYKPLPQGSTKIANIEGLKGLNESQIYRQGQDIYKLPEVDKIVNPLKVDPEVPVVEPTSNIDAYIEAMKPSIEGATKAIEIATTPSPAEDKIDPITQRIIQDTEKFEQKPQDFQTELDKYGFGKNIEQLQQLMPQIASTKAQYDKLALQVQNQPISSRIIGGTIDKLQRQQAIELGGLSAMAEALQGNINMAMDIAQKTIDIKYEPIQMSIDNQKFQLEQVYSQLDREEQRKADALKIALDERQRQIDEEKQQDEGIYNIMLAAAQNGADNATLQKIMKSSSPRQAILNAGGFMSIVDMSKPVKIGTDDNGNDIYYTPITGTVKTADQLTVSQLGKQVGTIKGLPAYDTESANPGMSRSDRNNNPGNIKISDYTKEFAGVIGVESKSAEDGGNFLIFENPQAGLDAIGRLLLEGKSYQNVNAETAIKRYNNNGTYGASDVGLDPNKDFQSQIQDPIKRREVARAIAMAEGWSGGATDVYQQETISQSAKNWANLIADGKADLSNVPAEERTDVVNALAITPTKSDLLVDLVAKEKAQTAINLINHSGLKNAVGTIKLGRYAPFQWGAKADFIASVEQLISGLSLDGLIEAKSRGATFGALSDSEMRILASAATKIGTWRKLDDSGNVIGYKARESDFKAELENISKILLRASKYNVINQFDNQTESSTPTITGKTSSGIGYKIIE